mgnify:CR=1 FL=1
MIKVGTSGWMYDHWIGPFYPDDLPKEEMLAYYSQNFSTVEINNTFYQLPEVQSVKNWMANTPDGFTFVVKASRYITHMKNLKDPKESTHKFFDVIRHLKPKLGPILFQLPTNWHVNVKRLESFLKVLPEHHDYVIELRHSSWFCEEIFETLMDHEITLCFHDFSGKKTPLEITNDKLIYVRLHGVEGHYEKKYSTEQLRWWAEKLEAWSEKVKEIYVFFNNDARANAIENAKQIWKMFRS